MEKKFLRINNYLDLNTRQKLERYGHNRHCVIERKPPTAQRTIKVIKMCVFRKTMDERPIFCTCKNLHIV